jgi:methyl halide transferase
MEIDWESWYVAEQTPWDLGAPLPLLVDALDDGVLGTPGTVVVPGGGRGHDAAALAAAGWHTTVVDLAPTAAAYAAAHYPELRYVVGDALDPAFVLARLGGPVDLLWDHTFFCALPPELRPRVGALAAAVVKPGGLVASGVFPLGRDPGKEGPPWGYAPEHLEALLPGFERVLTGEPAHLNPSFTWQHQLVVWRRGA